MLGQKDVVLNADAGEKKQEGLYQQLDHQPPLLIH